MQDRDGAPGVIVQADAFLAAHGLHGLQANAFFAAHGLQAPQADFAAQGLQAPQPGFLAAHGLAAQLAALGVATPADSTSETALSPPSTNGTTATVVSRP